MSALEIHPVRRTGKEIQSNSLSTWCQQSRAHNGTARAAKKKVTLLGYPLGFLCDPCAKEWLRIWEDAATNWEPTIEEESK